MIIQVLIREWKGSSYNCCLAQPHHSSQESDCLPPSNQIRWCWLPNKWRDKGSDWPELGHR